MVHTKYTSIHICTYNLWYYIHTPLECTFMNCIFHLGLYFYNALHFFFFFFLLHVLLLFTFFGRALLLIISVCCFPDLIAYSLVTVKLLISGDISNYLLCHSVTLIRTNFSICCSHYSFFSTFISPNCLKKVTSMHGSLLCTIRREKNMPNQRT